MTQHCFLAESRRRAILAAAAALAVCGASRSMAQSGAEPVRMIVGFPAGSSSDVTARALAEQMQRQLKRPIVVDNKPGASGRIAVSAVRASKPDGTTILFAPHGPMALFQHVFKDLNYDPDRDFLPISQVATFEFGLFANSSLPVSNLQELRTWSASNPARATYGSPGVGTTPHFLATALAHKAGMTLTHIPFSSPPQIMTSLVGKHLALSMGPIDEALPFIKDGKVKALGTSGSTRAALLPEVPTFAEQGVKLELLGWFGVFAPTGTPVPILKSYEQAVQKAVTAPEVRARFLNMNMTPTGTSGSALAKVRQDESVMWANVVRETGFKPED